MLDGKAKALLDRSTAQINAPTAWKAGYEGQGVKVAVCWTPVSMPVTPTSPAGSRRPRTSPAVETPTTTSATAHA
ncbi:hypothetical protein GCM10010121_083450 [Streptomyces brasiliensis]|uniref:Uncharacterized protein n=1 Tax=Streptomyces brasiliensis TaxID=1954 RepID=A0A917LCH9_9ACTN|nr:hypothetical protein GCM10010121_083450 [Streptomyces brasiliensis]